MSVTTFLAVLGGLLALAFVANRLFRLTRIPDVIVLLAVGLLLGPVFGWVQPAAFRTITDALGTLALILILFEGGLDLNLRDTIRHFPGGVLLAFLGYGLSLGLVALVAWKSQGLRLVPALLVGAVLGCTSSSIVLPVLQQLEIRDPLRVILLIDSSLGDVLAVTTVSALLDFGARGGPLVGGFLGGVTLKMIASVAAAVLAGALWSRVLPLLSEQRFWQAVTFSVVLLLYAATEAAGHSGLLSVLAFGLTLANVRRIDPRLLGVFFAVEPPRKEQPEHHVQLLAFYSEMAFLVRTFFFVLLGVVVDVRGLKGHLLLTLGSLGALVVARAAAVKASRWSWGAIGPRDEEIALWVFPRGLITAVLAIQVLNAQGKQFDFLPALAFTTIVVTNILVIFGSIWAKRGGRLHADLAPVVASQDTSR
ncbi:MAG TPA: cation:proton antiporter [Terriglobia bacterium]|nr:cation:proton antiporter [Terriglobia bacterium]